MLKRYILTVDRSMKVIIKQLSTPSMNAYISKVSSSSSMIWLNESLNRQMMTSLNLKPSLQIHRDSLIIYRLEMEKAT